MEKVFAIHGAYSSPTIFNFLKISIPRVQWKTFDYQDKIEKISNICNEALDILEEDCHLIGHSLGGLIALWLAAKRKVKSVTTIATPLNGIDINFVHQMLSPSSFVREIASGGTFVSDIQLNDYSNIPVLHIVTTRGYNPFMLEPNDGVVTLRSQHAWNVGTVVDLPLNHSECMLSPKVAENITNQIKGNT
jgi:pimeloyl-ACP methyl ester carboxylesterase